MYGINSMYSICISHRVKDWQFKVQYFYVRNNSLNSGYNSTKVGTAYTGMNIK